MQARGHSGSSQPSHHSVRAAQQVPEVITGDTRPESGTEPVAEGRLHPSTSNADHPCSGSQTRKGLAVTQILTHQETQ